FRIWPPPTGNGSPGRWRSCSLTITGWQSCDGRGGAEAARRELGKDCRQGFGVIWRTVKMQPVATRLETGFAHGPREMRWQVGASYDERRGRGGVGLKIDGIQSVGRRRTGEARDASANSAHRRGAGLYSEFQCDGPGPWAYVDDRGGHARHA